MSILAGHPSNCCISGVKHEGTPTGTHKNIGSIPTYFAYPESKQTTKAILFLTDAFGHNLINNQLVADNFAENGYFVVMPDLFTGDPVPESVLTNGMGSFDIMEWVGRHGPGPTDPIIDAVLAEMRGPLGCTSIGAVGYCFGGKYVVRYLQTGAGRVDAGYIAHPSFVMADEVKAMKGPLAIAAAETDQIFPAEKRWETEGLLKEGGSPYQVTLYSGVAHGFAIKADLSQKHQRFAKEAAFVQALAWFAEYL